MALTKQQQDQLAAKKRADEIAKMETRAKAVPLAVVDRDRGHAPNFNLEVTPSNIGVNLTRAGQQEEAGRVIRVPLNVIEDNPFNARAIYREEDLASLAASIATRGIEQPIKVVLHPTKPGRYISIYGHRRRMAARIAGKHEIEAILDTRSYTDAEFYLASDRENIHEPQSFLDNALVWKKLLDQKVFASYSDLAENVGKSKAVVLKTVAIMALPEPVTELMREYPDAFRMAHCYELSLLFKATDVEKTLALAVRIAKEQLTVPQVEKARNTILEQKDRKRKEVSRQYKLVPFGPIKGGVIKDRDDGRVSLEVEIDDPGKRLEYVEKLKSLFPGIEGEPA